MATDIQIWMPYFVSTMAIVLSIFVAAWLHNRHIDTLNRRIDETNRRIDELLTSGLPGCQETSPVRDGRLFVLVARIGLRWTTFGG